MMKRFMQWGTCAFLLCVCSTGWTWEFNQDDNKEGWTTFNNISQVDVKDGNLVCSINANSSDPFINGPAGPYDGNRITGLEFRMKFSTDVSGFGGPAMYFFPVAGSHGSFNYQILYPNEWNVVFIDFIWGTPGGDSPSSWGDSINNIRIDFPDNIPEDYTIEIDWIRFVDDRLLNNNFEYGNLDYWKQIGAGTAGSFAIEGNDYFSEITSIAVTGLGSDQYHALEQEVYNGLSIAKGDIVSVVGAAKIPADSWDSNSTLWFRVREYNGTTEVLSDPISVTVFDEWFQFQSSLTMQYAPASRTSLSVQLYSKNPSGKVFYFDDIFVDVQTPPAEEIENPGWPINAIKLSSGQAITIDGVVTAAEYQGAQAMVLNGETVRNIPDPYFPAFNHNGRLTNEAMVNVSLEDISTTYYFMWDDQYFYAAVSAQDDNYSFVGPDPNGSDTLQFVFAETPDISSSANMYIPTIAPEDASGNILGKNNFGGWITHDIMGECEYAGKVDSNTSDWAVEIKIPWSAMQGDFANEVFPPSAGDEVGFSVLSIDYDGGALEWFACNYTTFPWESNGVDSLFFVDSSTSVSDWSIYE